GEVVGVDDAGAGVEAAAGRHHMGRVPDEEHLALAEPVGDPRLPGPRADALDARFEIRQAGGRPHHVGAALLGEPGGRLLLRVVAQVQQPVGAVVQRHQRAAYVGVVDVGHDEPAAPQLAGEVGGEADGDEVAEGAAVEADVQLLAHGAAGAARVDQTAGPDPVFVTGVPVADHRRDPVVAPAVPFEGDQFGVGPHPYAQAFGPLPQGLFELAL